MYSMYMYIYSHTERDYKIDKGSMYYNNYIGLTHVYLYSTKDESEHSIGLKHNQENQFQSYIYIHTYMHTYIRSAKS